MAFGQVEIWWRRTYSIVFRRKFLVRSLLLSFMLFCLYFVLILRNNEYYINDLYGYATPIEEWHAKAKATNFCIPTPAMHDRYANLKERLLHHPDDYLLIGSNWKDCERLAYDFFVQLMRLIEFFGRDKVVVAIFESGSVDNTQALLKQLEAQLDLINVTNTIIVSEDATRVPAQDRIEFLSAMRNEVLRVLRETSVVRKRKPNYMLFMNDIFFCAEDMMELAFQALLQNADIVSGLDFDPGGFYDTWVAKDMNGNHYNKEPFYTTDRVAANRIRLMNPTQCVCTWNGAVMLRAAPFLDHNLKYCLKPLITLFPNDPRYYAMNKAHPKSKLYEECSQSEMSQMCKDMINLGFTRFVIVPRVKVAYKFDTYEKIRKQYKFDIPFGFDENTTMNFLPMPLSQDCEPLVKGSNLARNYRLSGREILNASKHICRFDGS